MIANPLELQIRLNERRLAFIHFPFPGAGSTAAAGTAKMFRLMFIVLVVFIWQQACDERNCVEKGVPLPVTQGLLSLLLTDQ